MSWFYNFEGQSQGPISAVELEELIRSGRVTPETLVWREGLPNWMPYRDANGSAMVPVAPAVAAAEPGTTAACVECGQTLPKSEMIAYDEAFICASCKPLFFQKLREGVTTGALGAMWRDKRILVTALNPTLPPRCVKCDAPVAAPQKKVTLYWHHPAFYLGLLVNVILYAVLAMVVRKRSTALVSICEEHRIARRNAILIGWSLVVIGIGVFIMGAGMENGALMAGGGVAFFGGLIYGLARGRLVVANKIDKERLRISGCGEKFLAGFPEWTKS